MPAYLTRILLLKVHDPDTDEQVVVPDKVLVGLKDKVIVVPEVVSILPDES